jgi:hypothetical protein
MIGKATDQFMSASECWFEAICFSNWPEAEIVPSVATEAIASAFTDRTGDGRNRVRSVIVGGHPGRVRLTQTDCP